MKKLALLIVLCIFLTGCSSPAWETVDDTMDIPVGSWLDQTYSINISVPQEMKLMEETDSWKIYSTDSGHMEVETRTFLASDLDTAVAMLTGFQASELNILQTERFGLPEYQFAWVTHTDRGERLCRADMVVDGMDCYAVVCSILEEAGDSYASDVRQVIATFGLYVDEGV